MHQIVPAHKDMEIEKVKKDYNFFIQEVRTFHSLWISINDHYIQIDFKYEESSTRIREFHKSYL